MRETPNIQIKEKEEDLDFEISFFEKLLETDPDYIDALIPLAEDYTKKGMYKKGLSTDIRISALRPDDPVVHYNLACSYSLTKNTEEALRSLEKSLCLGYDDFDWLEKDPDLNSIKKTSKYRDIIKKFLK